jgi:hypothetical protein
MSYITKVKTQLKDGLILRRALIKLGYQLKEPSSRKSGKRDDLELAASKGSVWIGFKRSEENSAAYEMLADWGAASPRREDVINAIYQVYSQEKIMDLARVKGYSLMKNRMNAKGQIEMVLRKVG